MKTNKPFYQSRYFWRFLLILLSIFEISSSAFSIFIFSGLSVIFLRTISSWCYLLGNTFIFAGALAMKKVSPFSKFMTIFGAITIMIAGLLGLQFSILEGILSIVYAIIIIIFIWRIK